MPKLDASSSPEFPVPPGPCLNAVARHKHMQAWEHVGKPTVERLSDDLALIHRPTDKDIHIPSFSLCERNPVLTKYRCRLPGQSLDNSGIIEVVLSSESPTRASRKS